MNILQECSYTVSFVETFFVVLVSFHVCLIPQIINLHLYFHYDSPVFACSGFLNQNHWQDALITRSSTDKEKLLENSGKHIADIEEHFKGQQQLLTGLDLLHKEVCGAFWNAFIVCGYILKNFKKLALASWQWPLVSWTLLCDTDMIQACDVATLGEWTNTWIYRKTQRVQMATHTFTEFV